MPSRMSLWSLSSHTNFFFCCLQTCSIINAPHLYLIGTFFQPDMVLLLLFRGPADSAPEAIDLNRVAFSSLDISIPIRGETIACLGTASQSCKSMYL